MLALNWEAMVSAAMVLFFIFDPLGNVPAVNAILKNLPSKKRAWVLLRESIFALIILFLFAAGGAGMMSTLGLSASSLNIAGGTLLMVIALQMVFPGRRSLLSDGSDADAYIVPIATPMIAGPSAIAVIMLQSAETHLGTVGGLVMVLMAWVPSTLLLCLSPFFVTLLGPSIIRAVERLMGMLLLLLAVQMSLNGLAVYLAELKT